MCWTRLCWYERGRDYDNPENLAAHCLHAGDGCGVGGAYRDCRGHWPVRYRDKCAGDGIPCGSLRGVDCTNAACLGMAGGRDWDVSAVGSACGWVDQCEGGSSFGVGVQ